MNKIKNLKKYELIDYYFLFKSLNDIAMVMKKPTLQMTLK